MDCTWSAWRDWSACNATCGYAVRTRSRDEVPAQYGGADCTGDAIETEVCPTSPCSSQWQLFFVLCFAFFHFIFMLYSSNDILSYHRRQRVIVKDFSPLFLNFCWKWWLGLCLFMRVIMIMTTTMNFMPRQNEVDISITRPAITKNTSNDRRLRC